MYHVLDGDISDIIYHIWSDWHMTKRYENRDLYLVDTKTGRSIAYNVGQNVVDLLNYYENQLNKIPPKIREVWCE